MEYIHIHANTSLSCFSYQLLSVPQHVKVSSLHSCYILYYAHILVSLCSFGQRPNVTSRLHILLCKSFCNNHYSKEYWDVSSHLNYIHTWYIIWWVWLKDPCSSSLDLNAGMWLLMNKAESGIDMRRTEGLVFCVFIHARIQTVHGSWRYTYVCT